MFEKITEEEADQAFSITWIILAFLACCFGFVKLVQFILNLFIEEHVHFGHAFVTIIFGGGILVVVGYIIRYFIAFGKGGILSIKSLIKKYKEKRNAKEN